MNEPENISFRGGPAIFFLESPYVILADPLILEGILPRVQDLLSKPTLPAISELEKRLRTVEGQYMEAGVYTVSNFKPGWYRLDLRDVIQAESDPAACDLVAVDSATIVLADFAHLQAICTHLNWEAYDEALSTGFWDDIEEAIGGPYYAVIGGYVGLGDFEGNGLYRIKPGALVFQGEEG